MKLRSMWRTESVDSTVLMPRRAASRPASVLLPVPLVPARSTVTDLRCSRMLQGTISVEDKPTHTIGLGRYVMDGAQQHAFTCAACAC